MQPVRKVGSPVFLLFMLRIHLRGGGGKVRGGGAWKFPRCCHTAERNPKGWRFKKKNKKNMGETAPLTADGRGQRDMEPGPGMERQRPRL